MTGRLRRYSTRWVWAGYLVALVVVTFILPCRAASPQKTVLVLGRGAARSVPPAYESHVVERAALANITASDLKNYAAGVFQIEGSDADTVDAVLALSRQLLHEGKGVVLLGLPNEPGSLSSIAGTTVRKSGITDRLRLWFIDTGHPLSQGLRGEQVQIGLIQTGELANDCRALLVADQEGGLQPYVWIRTPSEGGRLFLALLPRSALGTGNFERLVGRAVQWACGDLEPDRSVFRYTEVENIPVYRPDRRVERQTKMQLPLSAEDSIKRYALPEGLRIRLFASEPDVVKPICMTFDARGRLWVAESVDYPNNVLPDPEQNGNDRIKILEDTDGDGRVDKTTIFADHINIPTSLLHVRQGLLVACAPHILLLRDTDGDDRADVREIIFTGFGRGDTHAVHSNFQYGFDNWIWGTVGYSGGAIEVNGRRITFRQGVFRFKPDGSAFEFVAPTTNNTWGLGFSPDGDIFVSTANNQHSFYLAIPNRYFERVRGWYELGIANIEDHKRYHPIGPYRQVDFHGGYTAASGYSFYGDSGLLPFLNNRAAFVCEPTGHLIHACLPVQRGSHFITRDGYNLVASDDEWAAPIAAAQGPDGAVWFLDWYNFIVQHNPTPPGFRTGKGNAYETPLRDKSHGRVYRVFSETGVRQQVPRFDVAPSDDLVAFLGHDSLWWRLQAQQQLVERGDTSVVPAVLEKALAGKDTRAAIHALWVLHGLGAVEALEQAATACLNSSHPAVRRAAVQTLPATARTVRALVRSDVFHDPDFRVRLAALLKLADCPPAAEATGPILETLTNPETVTDRWLPLAAICAAATNDRTFLNAALQRSDKPTEQLLRAVEVVAEHWSRGEPSEAATRTLVALLDKAPPAMARAFCQGVIRGWPSGRSAGILQEKDRRQILHLVRSASAEVRPALVLLLRRIGWTDAISDFVNEVRRDLLGQIDRTDAPVTQRLAAVEQLLTLDTTDEVIQELVERISVRQSPEFNEGIIRLLARVDSPGVSTALLQHWRELSPELRRQTVATLLQRPEWTRDLLEALETGTLNRGDLTLDQQQVLLNHPDRSIREQAAALLRTTASTSGRDTILQEYLPLAKEEGDPAAGRQVFEKNCAKCHRFDDLGEAVGPDLTGIAVRGKEAILTDIIDPNRSVEGNFTQYLVLTTDGRILTGLLASETRTAIELIDNEGQRVVVLREQIEQIANSGKSLMPEGFEQQLTRKELVDLLAFLTQERRFVPLPIRRAATIVTTRGMFYSRDAQVERLVFDDWGPKTFKGVPFHLVDPRGDLQPNAIMLYSPNGAVSREMPRKVEVECNLPIGTLHILGGVAGWGYPASPAGTVSMIVRFHYADGTTEDHPLINGVHIADYIRVIDVPGSELAFVLRGRQLRYLAIQPQKREVVRKIEFIKGDDATAPIVMALTVELPERDGPAEGAPVGRTGGTGQ